MIAVVTWINVVGLRWGALLQNAATWAKFVAIAAFVILGFAIGKGDWHHFTASPWGSVHSLTMGVGAGPLLSAFGVALIALFWAYDGWVYIGWVAGEIKNPRRNVPLAMVLGVTIVGVIYLAMNMAYVYALPITEIAKHETIAHAAAEALFSPAAAVWLSALVAVSCFGAAACAILGSPRIYYAMARDGLFFRRMAEVHPKWRTPAFALIGQGIWAGVLTLSGRYDQLYTYVMFGMVLSYTLTVVGLFVLRSKRPDIPRAYRCTGYPWLPAIYVLIGTAWTLNTIFARPTESLAGTIIILFGVPVFVLEAEWEENRLGRFTSFCSGLTFSYAGRNNEIASTCKRITHKRNMVLHWDRSFSRGIEEWHLHDLGRHFLPDRFNGDFHLQAATELGV
jgi:APA family basic amino acid/polyamine antiporter